MASKAQIHMQKKHQHTGNKIKLNGGVTRILLFHLLQCCWDTFTKGPVSTEAEECTHRLTDVFGVEEVPFIHHSCVTEVAHPATPGVAAVCDLV